MEDDSALLPMQLYSDEKPQPRVCTLQVSLDRAVIDKLLWTDPVAGMCQHSQQVLQDKLYKIMSTQWATKCIESPASLNVVSTRQWFNMNMQEYMSMIFQRK